MRLRSLVASLLLLASLSFLVLGCPGPDKTEVKTPDKTEASMDDALALLPGSAIGAGTVDARAFFSSQTFGADLAKLVEKYVPIGPEAGFLASRDVDRVTFATYSYQGIDVAAVVVGRFDGAKIKQVAVSQTPTKAGVPLVVSQYAGREVYTVNNIGFTLLSDQRAIVGTEQGIRRVLERIKDRRVQRDLAPWMIATIETPGAAFAAAGDFASQPIPTEVTRGVPMPFLQQGLKAARVIGTFKDGVQVAGSLTYPEAASAEAASQSVKQTANMSKWLAIFGIKVHNVDIKIEKADIQFSFNVDDQSLRQLLASLPQWLGQ